MYQYIFGYNGGRPSVSGNYQEDTKDEVKKNNKSEDKKRNHFRYKKKLICIDALSMQIYRGLTWSGHLENGSLVWPEHKVEKDLMKDESGTIKKTDYGRCV